MPTAWMFWLENMTLITITSKNFRYNIKIPIIRISGVIPLADIMTGITKEMYNKQIEILHTLEEVNKKAKQIYLKQKNVHKAPTKEEAEKYLGIPVFCEIPEL